MTRLLNALAALFALFASSATAAPLGRGELDQVDSIAAREMAQTETPSVSMPYRVASSSKQFLVNPGE